MSIVDTIGLTMDKLADKVGNAIFHEEGRPVPVLRFAAGRNAALDWVEHQDPEMLLVLKHFVKKYAADAALSADEPSLTELILIADELRRMGHPEQAQYFADLNGARGWVDGFLSYVRAVPL